MFASGCVSGNVELVVGVDQVSLFSNPAPSAEQPGCSGVLKLHLSTRGSDEGLRLAVVDLDTDLGIFVLLVLFVPDALEVAAVAEQVEG